MSWKVWGERCMTADFAGNLRVRQSVYMNRDVNLKAVLAWMIFYNSPVFTSLKIEVYSDRSSGSPGTLLGTLTCPYTLAEITSQSHAARQVPFIASNAIPLKADDLYHLVFGGADYLGDETSAIYIMKAYPAPIYTTGFSDDRKLIGTDPYQMGFIAEDVTE